MLELGHSQAAGAEAMLVMLALLLAILIASAAFAATLMRDIEHEAMLMSRAAQADALSRFVPDSGWDGQGVQPRGRDWNAFQ